MKRIFYFLITVILLSVPYGLMSEDQQLTPAPKNPMEEIGFYKEHVYDFKDVVSVDLETGAAIVKIPLASIKGVGAASAGLSLSYSSSAKIHVASSYAFRDDDPGIMARSSSFEKCDPSLIWFGPKSTNIYEYQKSSVFNWQYFIPSLSQRRQGEQYGSFNLSADSQTIEFRDESGVNHTLYLTSNDMGKDSWDGYDGDAYFISGDGSIKSSLFHTRKDPTKAPSGYISQETIDEFTGKCFLGDLYTTGGVTYSNLYNSHDINCNEGSCPCNLDGKVIEKYDLDGNFTKWDFTGEPKRIYNSANREITISTSTLTDNGETFKEETITSPGNVVTKLRYKLLPDDYYESDSKPWGDSLGRDYLPKEFLTKVTLPDGSFYKFEYYHLDGTDGYENGNAYIHIGKKYKWGVNFQNYTDSSNVLIHPLNESEAEVGEMCVPMLKRIILPTGGSIELKYGIMKLSKKQESATFPNPSLSKFNNILPGLIPLLYAAPKEGELSESTTAYFVHLGVKELIFKDADGHVIERREYQNIEPYNTNQVAIDELRTMTNYTLKDVRSLDKVNVLSDVVSSDSGDSDISYFTTTFPETGSTEYQSCKSWLFTLVYKSYSYNVDYDYSHTVFGRRVNIYDGSGNLLSRQDIAGGNMNFNFWVQNSGMGTAERNRERIYINYRNPGTTDYSRKVTVEQYQPRILDKLQMLGYHITGLTYKVHEETKEIEDTGNSENVVSVVDTATYYKGLDSGISKIENGWITFSYINSYTHGIALPVGTTTTVKKGDNVELTTYNYSYYNFSSLQFPWENLGKSIPLLKQTVVEKKPVSANSKSIWLTKLSYDMNKPWRKVSERTGMADFSQPNDFPSFPSWKDFLSSFPLGSFSTGLPYDFTGDSYTVNYTYYDTTDKSGLLSSRIITSSTSGSPSSISEEFDYSYGVLSSYSLKGTDGLSLTTTRTIDAATGLVTKQTNPDGTYTEYFYDNAGRLTGIKPSNLSKPTSIAYKNYTDDSNLTEINKLARVTVTSPSSDAYYYYDGIGRLKCEAVDDGELTTWSKLTYQGLDRVSVTFSGATTNSGAISDTTTDYINSSSLWSKASKSTTEYDGYGRTVSTSVYKANASNPETTTLTSYMGFDKELILKDSKDDFVEGRMLEYDVEGNLISLSIKDAQGASYISKVNYSYHPLFNKLEKVVLNKEDGSPGQTRTFSYDSLGNLIQTTTPEEGVINYESYNVFGKPLRKVHGSKVIQFTYDGLGREVLRENPSDAGSKINTTWGETGESTGKITQVSTSSFNGLETTIKYNYVSGILNRGQLSKRTFDLSLSGESNPIVKSVEYTYNENNGQLKTLTYPIDTVNGQESSTRTLVFGYNNKSALTSIRFDFSSQSGSPFTTYLLQDIAYNPYGSIGYTLANSIRTDYVNDSLGRLLQIDNSLDGIDLQRFDTYSYDSKGNILGYKSELYNPITDTTESMINNYSYDKYNRLIKALYQKGEKIGVQLRGGGVFEETFDYDFAGNMLSKSFTNSSPYSFKEVSTFFRTSNGNNNNRLPGAVYDSYGNVTSIDGKTISYDSYNRTVQITKEGVKYLYYYDGEGNRVLKEIQNPDGSKEQTLYVRESNGKILEELKRTSSADGQWSAWEWQRDYYYFGSKLITTISAE